MRLITIAIFGLISSVITVPSAQALLDSGHGFSCDADVNKCTCTGGRNSRDCKKMKRMCEDVDKVICELPTQDKCWCTSVRKKSPKDLGPGTPATKSQ